MNFSFLQYNFEYCTKEKCANIKASDLNFYIKLNTKK